MAACEREFPCGRNITKIWAGQGWALPVTTSAWVVHPGATGLVEAMDDDVLVAELGSMGHFAVPLIYVVNKAVSLERGGAPVRTTLRGVAGTQPLEGDCAAGACQCVKQIFETVIFAPSPL